MSPSGGPSGAGTTTGVTLTGRDLTIGDVMRVARDGAPVRLDPAASHAMARTHEIVLEAAARGGRVYGLTTAVGVLKRVDVGGADAAEYSRRLIRHHLVAQGEPAPRDVVRATMLRLTNAFASGVTGVRPLLAERLVTALNEDEAPTVRRLGSVGQADLAAMADLAAFLFGDTALDPGEGLALVSSNAFSTAWATLAVSDARRIVETIDTSGALSLEGLAANASALDPAIADTRPYPGIRASIARIRALLDGSAIFGTARDDGRRLQDPLSFRNLVQLQGAGRDALAYVEEQLAIELNASDSNPIVVAADHRILSVANFEILPIVAALDYLRIVLGTVIGASAERALKLLETPWSGLPTGLVPDAGTNHPGLSYLGIAGQALAAEARLLGQPVSLELTSTSHAEGIEDRTTSAPLAARRLAEQVLLGERVAAIELIVGAQAAQLRGRPLGRGTTTALERVRAVVPFLEADREVPDVESLTGYVREGSFASGG
jgi:histidine ammonia-lyase